jgi:hypothetical protein
MVDGELTRTLLWMAMDGWLGARHEVDSLYMLVQDDPQWKEKFREQYQDPFRRQMTEERFQPLLKAVRMVLEGADPDSTLAQALTELQKIPN